MNLIQRGVQTIDHQLVLRALSRQQHRRAMAAIQVDDRGREKMKIPGVDAADQRKRALLKREQNLEFMDAFTLAQKIPHAMQLQAEEAARRRKVFAHQPVAGQFPHRGGQQRLFVADAAQTQAFRLQDFDDRPIVVFRP